MYSFLFSPKKSCLSIIDWLAQKRNLNEVLLKELKFGKINFHMFNVDLNNLSSFPVVFLLGLTAGISTCMALIGGLVLGISTRYAEKHPHLSGKSKFIPHLYFNLGRISFFFIFGMILGLFGSVIKITPFTNGLITLIASLYMLLLGLQTIRIFPKLDKYSIKIPKIIYQKLGFESRNEKEYSHLNSFLLGALTFFLPCGITQAVQLYAISTGDFLNSGLTMLFFALGTAPGLIGIGAVVSLFKGKYSETFYKIIGLIVILFAISTIRGSLNILGFFVPEQTTSSTTNSSITNGEQIIRMKQNFKGYFPNSFVVKKDIPVKWVIVSEDINNCASSIYSEELKIDKLLVRGENVLQFTATKTGLIKFSCSVGMFNGYIEVID